MQGFPKRWTELPGTSPELADAEAAVDKLVVKSTTATPPTGSAAKVSAEFPPLFNATTDYVRVAGYRLGGDNPLFAIRHHKFFLHHSAHYDLLQIQPVIAALATPAFGGAPPKAVADDTKPITNVLLVRDQGSIRFPPFVIALSSGLIFGITTYVLHQRDKEIWAAKAAKEQEEAAGPEPAAEPEPAGV